MAIYFSIVREREPGPGRWFVEAKDEDKKVIFTTDFGPKFKVQQQAIKQAQALGYEVQ